MPRTRTTLLVATAAIFGAAILGPACGPTAGASGTAYAKDDKADAAKAAKKLEAIKKEREDAKTKLRAAKKWFTFDLSYTVDSTKLDSRWSWADPPSPQSTYEEGLQANANWESKPGSRGIGLLIQKWEQSNSAKNTVGSFNFDEVGMTCKVAELEKVITGFSEQWKKKAGNIVESKTEKVQKAKGMGPADWFVSFTGDDPDSHKRERHEWYVWQTANTTWMAHATFDAATAEKKDWLDNCAILMKALTENKSAPK
ncbi:MAG: hypothetical protein K8T90_13270 [Planctomycetes bacterium]|nr:hypothetical protein [Planctomycetota bacterium]